MFQTRYLFRMPLGSVLQGASNRTHQGFGRFQRLLRCWKPRCPPDRTGSPGFGISLMPPTSWFRHRHRATLPGGISPAGLSPTGIISNDRIRQIQNLVGLTLGPHLIDCFQNIFGRWLVRKPSGPPAKGIWHLHQRNAFFAFPLIPTAIRPQIIVCHHKKSAPHDQSL